MHTFFVIFVDLFFIMCEKRSVDFDFKCMGFSICWWVVVCCFYVKGNNKTKFYFLVGIFMRHFIWFMCEECETTELKSNIHIDLSLFFWPDGFWPDNKFWRTSGLSFNLLKEKGFFLFWKLKQEGFNFIICTCISSYFFNVKYT